MIIIIQKKNNTNVKKKNRFGKLKSFLYGFFLFYSIFSVMLGVQRKIEKTKILKNIEAPNLTSGEVKPDSLYVSDQ